MTIAEDTKARQSSERFMLVRLNFKVDHIGTEYLVSGVTYRFPVLRKPVGFSVMKYYSVPPAYNTITTYTEVFSLPVYSGEWFFDSATNEIVLLKSTSPGLDVAYFSVYQKYLTGGINRLYQTTPNESGSYVDWEPLLESYPEINQSIEDFSTGNLSISSSELNIINAENWLGEYLVGNATILNQEVKIWFGINNPVSDPQNTQIIFSGSMVSISTQGLSARIKILDDLQKLNEQALFGLSQNASTISTLLKPNIFTYPTPNDVGSSIPRHFARRTIHGFDKVLGSISGTSDFFNGICLKYGEPSSTANRLWICGRVRDTYGYGGSSNINVSDQGFGSVSGTASMDTFVRAFNVPSPSNLVYGQTVTWTTSGTQRGIIAEVGSFTYLGNPYNLKIFCINSNVGTTGNIFTVQPAIGLYFKRGNETANLVYGRDYTIILGSDGLVEATLVTDFEANFPTIFTTAAGRYVNPDTDKLAYYYLTTGSLNHSRILKTMLEAAGLVINATSFTDAENDLDANVCFSIPFMGTGQIGSYADYVSAILESTGGYLTMNIFGEIEYKLYEDPTTPTPIDVSTYSDLTIDFEYQDFYSKIQATNNHFKDDKLLYSTSAGSEKTEYAENSRAFYLSEMPSRTRYIAHVLETMTNSMPRVLRVASNRKATIQISSATHFLDYKLGDDIAIYSDKLPGIYDNASFKIISKSISTEKTTIRAIDLFDY